MSPNLSVDEAAKSPPLVSGPGCPLMWGAEWTSLQTPAGNLTPHCQPAQTCMASKTCTHQSRSEHAIPWPISGNKNATNICGTRRSEGSSPARRSRGSQEGAKSSRLRATWMRSCSSCSFSLVLPWEDGLQPWRLEVSVPEIHLCSSTSCRRSFWSVAKAWIQSSLLICAPAATSSRTDSLKQSLKKIYNKLLHCVLSIKVSAFPTWRVCAMWSSRQGTMESWGRGSQSSPGHQGWSLPLEGPPHTDTDYWWLLSRADWPCCFLCHSYDLWQRSACWGHWEEESKVCE